MIELWGGHECTVNRVGDRFFDQTIRSGHEGREDDLERFAALGLKALRYPVLWERVAPDDESACDWRWSDARLARIRSLGMRPIVGLLHHGSGPRRTNLLDPDFPRLFANYARQAAERYPWVQDWTPINEPLTTARFSALYGLWHPHAANEAAFWTALFNQIDAVRLAMAEIREINPKARLVQTEDLGRTYATPAVSPQAEFDNDRRWMSFDLLCGRVGPGHPLYRRLTRLGFGARVRATAETPCPPDLIGINHYLTSDRFLDHRAEAYPPERRGGNRFMRFADVEAIRVTLPAPQGLEGALEEAWSRYGLPLAVTECHNGCTREEQVRWVREAWAVAHTLRDRGVDIQAVTAWALLGSFDWQSLLTRDEGRYETGVFDVRDGSPRPTALAAELTRLATGADAPHPATSGPGWWRRDVRLEYAPVALGGWDMAPSLAWSSGPTEPERPLLITGATGTLGRAFARACQLRGIPYRLTRREDLPLDDAAAMAERLSALRPWAVVNAAGWVRVDDAEAQPDACHAANAEGAARLARACAERGLPLAGFSSDLVFDGCKSEPYLETDAPSPLNVYGESKAEAERAMLAECPGALVIRTAAFFSPHDPHNFAEHVRRTLAAGSVLEAAEDLTVSPTFLPDLADVTLDLLIDGEAGLRHLANAGAVTWAEFARRIARALSLDEGLVRGVDHLRFGWAAPRPRYAALGGGAHRLMPDLDDAIRRHAAILAGAGRLEREPAASPEPQAFSAALARP